MINFGGVADILPPPPEQKKKQRILAQNTGANKTRETRSTELSYEEASGEPNLDGGWLNGNLTYP